MKNYRFEKGVARLPESVDPKSLGLGEIIEESSSPIIDKSERPEPTITIAIPRPTQPTTELNGRVDSLTTVPQIGAAIRAIIEALPPETQVKINNRLKDVK